MEKDPVPPERVELIKCEIKTELEEAVAFRSPLLRKRRSNISEVANVQGIIKPVEGGEDVAEVQSSIDDAIIGDLAD